MQAAKLNLKPTWYAKDGGGRAFDPGNGVIVFIERNKEYRTIVNGEISSQTISGDEFITLMGEEGQEVEVAVTRVYEAASGLKYAEVTALEAPVGKVTKVSADELWNALGVANTKTEKAKTRKKSAKTTASAEMPL